MKVNIIDRAGAEALIAPELSKEIFDGVTETSAVLKLARKLPNMSSKQQRLPVATSLTSAYFVDGDNTETSIGNKSWDGVNIEASEIACIVPIPRTVLDDSDFDIWEQVKNDVITAFGKIIDRAILFGENAPSYWPTPIKTGIENAGNIIEKVNQSTAYSDILGGDGLVSKVEENGHIVTGHLGKMKTRGYLRNIVDNNGQPIFKTNFNTASEYDIDGVPVVFPLNGSMIDTDPALISGDWKSLVYSIRQDLTMKLFTEGVIQNPDGTIAYNLMQQDMVALRFVMRLGWQLPNPPSRLTDDSTYPFAMLVEGVA